MNIDSFLPKLAISALCMALVTACGGGDDSSVLLDKDGQKVGFLQTKDKKKEEKKEEIKKEVDITPTNTVPSVDKFLSSDGGKVEGQQLSPTVSLMEKGDANPVRFDQPGIVSEISPDPETLAIVNDLEEQIKQLEQQKQNVIQAGQSTTNIDNQLRPLRMQLREAQNAARSVGILDINSNRHNLVRINTIDLDSINELKDTYPGFNDAGVVKIDKIRTHNADGSTKEEVYQGSISREFNEVVLFAKAETARDKNGEIIRNPTNGTIEYHFFNNFLDAYFRSPSQAGWSYQTFGSFHDENLKADRGLDIGYQSVGSQTTELPTEGKATYKGISVAHYNNDQITMRNEIKADFGSRHLSYKTTEAPYHHTLGKEHIIEARQDLALTGEATWKKGINHFEGKMTAENGLSGKIEGRFYGPGAQEVGGVFGLKGQVNGKDAHYVGGFGAAIK